MSALRARSARSVRACSRCSSSRSARRWWLTLRSSPSIRPPYIQIAPKMSRRPTSVSVSRQSRSDIVGQTHSGIVGPPPFYRGHGPCRVAASWWTKVVLVLMDLAGVGHRCLHERSGRVKATRSSGPTERLSRLVTNSSCDQRTHWKRVRLFSRRSRLN